MALESPMIPPPMTAMSQVNMEDPQITQKRRKNNPQITQITQIYAGER